MPDRPGLPSRRLALVLTGLATLAIAAITLTPIPGAEEQAAGTPLDCIICGSAGAVDVLYNLLLFLPLGFGLRWLGVSPGRVVLVSFLATLSIEAAQLSLVAGRDASLSDLLTNTAGGGLGALLWEALPVLVRPAGRSSRLLVFLAALLPAGTLSGAAWLLGPAPPATLWFGQWAPDIGMYEHYEGRVLSATLQGRPMPPRALRDLNTAIDWRDQPLEVSATFTKAGPEAGIAPIVSVFDRSHTKVLFLGQESATRLRFEARVRAENFRFRPLALAFDGALDAPAADTLTASARFDGRSVRLAVRHGEDTRTREVALSPALGWALVAPLGGTVDRDARLFSAVWLALLWIPLGYYLARSRAGSSAGWVLVPAGAAALVTALVTVLAGFPFNHWSELAAAGGGAAAGSALAGVIRRREQSRKHERPTRR